MVTYWDRKGKRKRRTHHIIGFLYLKGGIVAPHVSTNADPKHRHRLLIPSVVLSFRKSGCLPYSQLDFELPLGSGLFEYHVKEEGDVNRVGQCLIDGFIFVNRVLFVAR